MTRKDYNAAAAIVREYMESHHRAIALDVFVALFSRDNSKFDVKRFRDACIPTKDIEV